MAVFLALGLGILFGASFIDQNVVDALRKAQNRIEERSAKLRSEVLELERTNKNFVETIESSETLLVRGVLKDRPALVLSFESSDAKAVQDVAAVLMKAGARLEGAISLSNKLDLSTEERRKQVAIALGATVTDEDAVAESLIKALTDSLSGRSVGSLQRLVDGQLGASTNISGMTPKPLPQLASPGTALVIVSPGLDAKLLNERLVLSLVKSLSEVSVVAVVETGVEQLPLLDALRQLDLKVVTVDGIETPRGHAFLALGLQAGFGGKFGDYGNGKDATARLPEPIG